jgi:hypothetical protein
MSRIKIKYNVVVFFAAQSGAKRTLIGCIPMQAMGFNLWLDKLEGMTQQMSWAEDPTRLNSTRRKESLETPPLSYEVVAFTTSA